MNILALECYYGGSHKAFLDGWIPRSRHHWTVLSLPAHKWKWRMRHGAITLADRTAELLDQGHRPDLLLTSDMLNLAEYLGLAPRRLRDIPTVVYFHENQLTYPVQHQDERDFHYVLNNITTAMAASAVWFNTAYHRDAFLAALPAFFNKMPDYRPTFAIDRIAAKAVVAPPGIDPIPPRPRRAPGPLRICWAARWEHDKNPETFFDAVGRLRARGVDFRLDVLGEQFRRNPPIFDRARESLAGHIDRWGYQPRRADYLAALHQADVFVSTAHHEFFGLSAVEAIAAGAWPLLPNRLSYPEILAGVPRAADHLHDGSAADLAERLAVLARRLDQAGTLWPDDPAAAAGAMTAFAWPALQPRYDDALDRLARVSKNSTTPGL